jgi:predicted Zn-ribbon and HTH transcriptional regulator
MKSSEPVMKTMMRLAGGSKTLTDRININAFMRQAEQYEELAEQSVLNNIMQMCLLMGNTHPFLPVRASEIKKWGYSDTFRNLIKYSEGDTARRCLKCKSEMENSWKFCRVCGYEN